MGNRAAPDHKTSSLAALGLTARAGREAQITGLTVDSREVRTGVLFAALPGARVHGGEFIKFALQMGAGAILTDAQGAEIAAAELANRTRARRWRKPRRCGLGRIPTP